LVNVGTRRRLLLALGAGALAPRLSLARQGKVWRVGFLSVRSRETALETPTFLEGMRELGYVEGKNVNYEWRFADGKYERLRPLADELVRLKVDVIVASGTSAVSAAKDATRSIPIVMLSAVDPVARGFIASLARPGGNITGVANMIEGTNEKQLDLLVETIPRLTRVAVLMNPDEVFSESVYKSIQIAAKRHALTLMPVRARTLEEIEQAFATMKRERCQALLVAGSSFFTHHYAKFPDWAAKAHLPAMYYRREFVEAGGLMSYGRNVDVSNRRPAVYVDKILKGAKPADLPVEEPSLLELVLNKRAAKALGVTFPGKVLVRADKIID
jgi:putative tryptophan/tyrosine transport system substrate-binding protein